MERSGEGGEWVYTYPYDFNYFRAAADSGLVNDVAKAINGEFTAIACYEQLAKMAPNEEFRKRILEIREDEVRHLRTFSQIYTNLTGRQPVPQKAEECAKEFVAGLNTAFKDEQETVDFYHTIANKANDPFIKDAFTRAAADEQNHAVWFLYMMMKCA